VPAVVLGPVAGEGPGVLTLSTPQLREDALAAWAAGLRAAMPEAAVERAVAGRPDLRTARPLVVAVGKAAAGMMRGCAAALGGKWAGAFVLLPAGSDSGELPSGVVLLRGGHPHPTAEGAASTARILAEVSALDAGGRLLLLLSGGASALLEAPAPGLRLDDVIAAHRALVKSGLPIAQINLVRGCLSAIKAGGLADAAGSAAVTTLAISDVEGDDPAAIGSGPTVKPAATRAARARLALDLLGESGLRLPAPATAFLERLAASGDAAEALGGDGGGDYTVIASIASSVAAASIELASRGYAVTGQRGYLSGDTASAAAHILEELGSGAGPRAIVFGGETTVAVPVGGAGRGGRNLDLSARLALVFSGRDGVVALAAGTDGIDGSSRAAGACVDGGTADRAARDGYPLDAALAAFDTEPALDAAGDLVAPGATGTNVGDLVVVVAG